MGLSETEASDLSDFDQKVRKGRKSLGKSRQDVCLGVGPPSVDACACPRLNVLTYRPVLYADSCYLGGVRPPMVIGGLETN